VTGDATYTDRAVLVTGGQGFLGSWLVDRLLQEGALVIVPQRSSREGSRFARERLEERCELVRVDLLDLPSLTRTLNEHQVEVVFHLGAQTVVAEAHRSPLPTFQTNVRGTYNLLEACRIGGLEGAERRVVVASSSHVYGGQGNIEYSEQTDLRPTRPYDVSKACVDMIARCYAATHELPVAVTRLANVYGGGDQNWSRVVPDVARALTRDERPVIRSDGTPKRDWLYVEDAVEVYLAVARSLEDPGLWGRAWNAGLGELVSVLELVQKLIAVSGKELEPEVQHQGGRQREVDQRYLDSTAIREQLAWRPQWSLDEGLGEAYRWYEQALNGARS
jgi:CDP-glucose 4,6-dehydratase